MQAAAKLRELLKVIPSRLESIPVEQASRNPAPHKWSPKEELGHLIDSASNNHQRIVRAQLEQHPSMPGYDGDAWVALHKYQARDWNELIETWQRFNAQLLAAAEAISPSAWSRSLSIAGGESITLQFLLDDYLDHLIHHLLHIGVRMEDSMSITSAG
jgi:DinB family protein